MIHDVSVCVLLGKGYMYINHNMYEFSYIIVCSMIGVVNYFISGR